MAEKISPVAVPSIGVSVSVDLGGGRQMVLQTHFDQAFSKEKSNQLLDRLTDLADRQRAKYDIEVIEADLEKMKKTRGQMMADLARLDVSLEAEQSARDDEIAASNARVDRIKRDAQEGWVHSGRTGPLVLSTQAKQQIAAAETEIKSLLGMKEKSARERGAEMINTKTNLAEWNYNIDKAERDLAQKIEMRKLME